jgi:hypothetical protein
VQAEGKLRLKPHQERLQQHRRVGVEALAKQILAGHFDKYRRPATARSGGSVARAPPSKAAAGAGAGPKAEGERQGKEALLGFREFAQALSHYREPGQPFPEKASVEKLWRACGKGDPRVLIESIYAAPEVQALNRFGFGKLMANPLHPTNPTVETGPFEVSQDTQVSSLKAIKGKKAAACPQDPSQVPRRIRYRYSRTPVQPPSTFDPAPAIAASSRPPACALELEHVYGYCRQDDMMPGANLCCVEGGRAVLYTAAAVGVIHDIETNRQRFLLGHTDDISALAVDGTGRLAATGALWVYVHTPLVSSEAAALCVSCIARRVVAACSCNITFLCSPGQMGKKPFVILWDVASGSEVCRVGQGFYQRLVCCLALSPDGTRLAGVSGDDHHMLGIWDVASKELLAEMGAQNGPPTQVLALLWLPPSVYGGECPAARMVTWYF